MTRETDDILKLVQSLIKRREEEKNKEEVKKSAGLMWIIDNEQCLLEELEKAIKQKYPEGQ